MAMAKDVEIICLDSIFLELPRIRGNYNKFVIVTL